MQNISQKLFWKFEGKIGKLGLNLLFKMEKADNDPFCMEVLSLIASDWLAAYQRPY